MHPLPVPGGAVAGLIVLLCGAVVGALCCWYAYKLMLKKKGATQLGDDEMIAQ